MARQRASAMVSSQASAQVVQFVRTIMSQIRPDGYTQAARMLAGADLADDLRALRCPIRVASGDADTITPPAGCRAVAQVAGAPWLSLGEVGHACVAEAPERVINLLQVCNDR